MPEQRTHRTEDRAGSSGERVHVNATVMVGKPAIIFPATEEQFVDSVGEALEDTPGKVVRPLRGRFAHVPYSSEDLVREKREEARLEDRSS